MRRTVVALVVIGCGGDSAPLDPDTAVSGERLKLARFDFPDGLSTWVLRPDIPLPDLIDIELGGVCEPRLWSDGVRRCTPELGAVFYLDDGCSRPVMMSRSVPFAAELHHGGCETLPGPPLVAAGDAMMAVTTLFRRDLDGACSRRQFPPDQHVTVFPATERSLSTFVTLATADIGDGPLAVEMLVGDDGLRVPLRPFERRYRAGCDLSILAGGDGGPCVPVGALLADKFIDDTCFAPAVAVDPQCEPPTLAVLPTFSCPLVYEVSDEPAAVDTVFEDPFNKCTALPVVEQPIVHTLGRRVDLPELVRAPEPGASRLQLIYASAGAMKVRDTQHMFDTVLGTECTLVPAFDGQSVICRPSTAFATLGQFSDASCTQQLPALVEVAPIISGCVATPPPQLVQFGGGISHIGARHTGKVFERIEASCVPVTTPLFEIGEALEPPGFALGSMTRDP